MKTIFAWSGASVYVCMRYALILEENKNFNDIHIVEVKVNKI